MIMCDPGHWRAAPALYRGEGGGGGRGVQSQILKKKLKVKIVNYLSHFMIFY